MANNKRVHRNKWWIFVVVLIALMGLGAFLMLRSKDTQPAPTTKASSGRTTANKPSPKPVFPLINLQSTVNSWYAKQSGTASVVIYDLANNKTVASLNPTTEYFAASLYKLYVAYVGYQKIADGTYTMNDPYLFNYTRGQCLDLMIRNSYSPCGEKMWDELGKDALTKKLQSYGITHTSMTSLTTTAQDAATILRMLMERHDLNDKYTKLYLDSLKTQPALYRRGLPSGFRNSVVYNKVGWNEQVEWHDAAIVTLPNNRSYVITVLTRNIGSRRIAELGSLIEAKLLAN